MDSVALAEDPISEVSRVRTRTAHGQPSQATPDGLLCTCCVQASALPARIEKARDMINSIVTEPEQGKVYTGKVVKIMDFGAFVNFFGKRDGLVHISQMTWERGANPKDLVKEGQEVKVKLLGFDDRGKVRLSMKVVDQQTGEEIKREKSEKAEEKAEG